MTALSSTPYVDVIRLLVVIFIVTNQRNADGFDPNCPLLSLKYMESSTFSQNGEDGVIDALFSIIGVKDRTYVEFGVENGTQCNTRLLRERKDFSGLLMDGSHQNESINLKKEYITVDNILTIFNKYHVPQYFDMISIDLDMFDWWILERILNAGSYRPRLIVTEVNPTLGHHDYIKNDLFIQLNMMPLVVIHPHHTYQTHWDHTRYFGANPKAFQVLGERFGYELVYCESCGVNCFLVQRNLLPMSCRSPPSPDIPRPCYYHSKEDNTTRKGHAPDSLKRLPLRVTDELLEQDLHHLSEKDISSVAFRGEDFLGLHNDEPPNMGLFLLLNSLLIISFFRICCSHF